ncbi:hypothetical protein D3C78_993470 [compost metagenome]
MAAAASYWPLGMACKPPRTTSAMYADWNRITPIMARSSLSKLMPSGRNNGSITEDMNSTVISGTPRQNSMKVTQTTFTAGMFERRPSASKIPSGKAPTMPTVAITRVSINPPHWLVGTVARPR